MNRLAAYIIKAVLKGTAMVALVLVAVASVIELVVQLDDVGLANYGLSEALQYVALRVPHKLFDVLPAATLIGALLGLGNLAVHRELVVMRASGLSQYRLLAAVGAAGVVLVVVMLLLGESLAPKLGDYARRARTEALIENVNAASTQSAWLKEGDNYLIHLREESGDRTVGQQVQVFELAGDSALSSVATGALLSAGLADSWDLLDFAETEFTATGNESYQQEYAERDYGFSRDIFELADRRVDLLPLLELRDLIARYQSRDLDATEFITEYWGRIANGVSVLIMATLALPFVLGSLRSADAGARMIIGLVIGLGYYVLGEVSANTGQVFALDPVMAAWAPSAVLLLLTAYAVARLR